MKRIVIDTSIAVFLTPCAPPPDGQEIQRLQVERLMRQAEPRGGKPPQCEFALASPTISELLIKVPQRKRASALEHLSASFAILDFDRLAALEAAELMTELPKGRNTERQVAKVDFQIAATASRWGWGNLCSFDTKFIARVRSRLPKLTAGEPPMFFVPEQVPLPLPTEAIPPPAGIVPSEGASRLHPNGSPRG